MNATTTREFLYDDCCPLCAGYTGIFAALGWTGRTGFSSVDEETVARLDFDRARHFIPLVDRQTGTILYGLDGILGVVAERVPPVAPLLRWRPVRRALDGFYWLVTYNRRHIVTAPPPACGVDCAPDFHAPAVVTYLLLTSALVGLLMTLAGAALAVLLVAPVAVTLAAGRRREWRINTLQASGHITSVLTATALTAGLATWLGAAPWMVTVLGVAVGLRKVWLRRWMVRPRRDLLGCDRGQQRRRTTTGIPG